MNAPQGLKMKRDGWREYKHPVTGEKLPGKSDICDNLGITFEVGIGYTLKCQRLGKNPFVARQFSADTGTLAHLFIEQTLGGKEPSAPEGTDPEMVRLALVSLASWKRWAANKKIRVIALEIPLVDGQLGYGTTIDAVLEVDDVEGIYDWKSGKVHEQMITSSAAIWNVWNKHNAKRIDEVIIVQVPTDGSDAAEYRFGLPLLTVGAACFLAALNHFKAAPGLKLPKPVKQKPTAEVKEVPLAW